MLPSPKSHRTECVSLPGSVNDPATWTGASCMTVWSGPAFTIGATFVTLTIAVSEPTPLSSSVTFTVTVKVPLSLYV